MLVCAQTGSEQHTRTWIVGVLVGVERIHPCLLLPFTASLFEDGIDENSLLLVMAALSFLPMSPASYSSFPPSLSLSLRIYAHTR